MIKRRDRVLHLLVESTPSNNGINRTRSQQAFTFEHHSAPVMPGVRRFALCMDYVTSNDSHFLAQVERLIDEQGEVLVLFRYARAAGAKDFMFFHEMPAFRAKLEKLAPDTNIVVYGERQLPLRGKVDEMFVERAVEAVPEGTEYLILCLEKTIHDYRPHHYWESFDDSAGETQAELRGHLEEYRGRAVAVGRWPPWPEENEHAIEAYVPDGKGMVRPGPY